MKHLFEHFQSPGLISLIEDVCVTFIEKTDRFIPTNHKDYWRQKLKTLAPHGLNIEKFHIAVFHILCGAFV